jgi:hypothetical protein
VNVAGDLVSHLLSSSLFVSGDWDETNYRTRDEDGCLKAAYGESSSEK